VDSASADVSSEKLLRDRDAGEFISYSEWESEADIERFDVLGKLQFEGKPLRDLLIQAIRYGENPEVRARLTRAMTNALDKNQLRDLLEERALAHDAMDASRVYRIRRASILPDYNRVTGGRLMPSITRPVCPRSRPMRGRCDTSQECRFCCKSR
jgi:hypothetical protein